MKWRPERPLRRHRRRLPVFHRHHRRRRRIQEERAAAGMVAQAVAYLRQMALVVSIMAADILLKTEAAKGIVASVASWATISA